MHDCPALLHEHREVRHFEDGEHEQQSGPPRRTLFLGDGVLDISVSVGVCPRCFEFEFLSLEVTCKRNCSCADPDVSLSGELVLKFCSSESSVLIGRGDLGLKTSFVFSSLFPPPLVRSCATFSVKMKSSFHSEPFSAVVTPLSLPGT